MLIIGAGSQEIQDALVAANELFAGNLEFKRFEYERDRRDGRQQFRVTLRVADSHEPGHTHGSQGRHLISACWHAHGEFFDALPEGTEIRAMHGTTYPGARWVDFNIGSDYRPRYASWACHCETGQGHTHEWEEDQCLA